MVSGFSLWYTRKIVLLNQSEQERNDHVELNIDLEDLATYTFKFKNISLRRIIYPEKVKYGRYSFPIKSMAIGAWGGEEEAIVKLVDKNNENIPIESNKKLTFFFYDDLGRHFKKECELYAIDSGWQFDDGKTSKN